MRSNLHEKVSVLSPQNDPPSTFSLWFRLLCQAVLRRAVDDILEANGRTCSATKRRLAAQAVRWVGSNTACWPLSFVEVCHVLGLQPHAVRARIQNLQARGTRKLTQQAAPRTPTQSAACTLPAARSMRTGRRQAYHPMRGTAVFAAAQR